MRLRLPSLLLLSGLLGCSSTKPPAPSPPALLRAERLASQAAKLTEQENWPAAAQAWQRASEDYALLNDRAREAVALHNLAQAEHHVGQTTEAHAHVSEAARLNQMIGQTNEWWRNQIVLLQLEADSSQSNTADRRFLALLPLAGSFPDANVRGLFLNELGLWRLRHGEWMEAEAAFNEAAAVFVRIGERNSAATATANLARLREKQNQPEAAVELWRKALDEFEKLGDPHGIADALFGLGRSLTAARKDLSLAEDCLRRATGNYRVLSRAQDQQQVLKALAECLRARGKSTDP